MLARAWDPPGPFWPGIVGGRDRTAGGTWLGVNAMGVIAGVLNRPGSLGPASGKRSRGELPLIALRERSAREAAEAVMSLDAGSFRSFNLVLADREDAIVVRGLGQGRPDAIPLAPGIHMITAHDPDDPTSPRVARHLPRFRGASPPEADGWGFVAGDLGGSVRRGLGTDQRDAARGIRDGVQRADRASDGCASTIPVRSRAAG